MKSRIQLSVIAPAFNEALGIQNFIDSIMAQISTMGLKAEIIIVDDGSEDETWSILLKCAKTHKILKPVRLISNFGQTEALKVGLQRAEGAYCLTLDADLQHPIDLIPQMWQLRDEFGLVQMQQLRRNDSFVKKIGSKLFYKAIRMISGLEIKSSIGDFRLIRRDILDFLLSCPESKVLRFLIPKYKLKSSILTFDALPRFAGESKYNLRKMIKFALHAIITTTTRPLYISGILSILASLISFSDFVFILFQKMTQNTIPGWASITGLISVAFSLIFATLFIFGVYLSELINSRPFIKSTSEIFNLNSGNINWKKRSNQSVKR